MSAHINGFFGPEELYGFFDVVEFELQSVFGVDHELRHVGYWKSFELVEYIFALLFQLVDHALLFLIRQQVLVILSLSRQRLQVTGIVLDICSCE